MAVRSLIWLLALVACLVALGFDGTLADPARSQDTAAAGKSAIVVAPLAPRPHGFLSLQPAGWQRLPAELSLYVDEPEAARGYAQILTALALAEDRALEAAELVVGRFRVQLHSNFDVPGPNSAAVFPAWDLQGVITGLDRAGDPEVMSSVDYRVEWTNGGALAVGQPEKLAEISAMWPEYRRGLGCVGVPLAAPHAADAEYPQVHATYTLNPLNLHSTRAFLQLALSLGVTQRLPGGLMLTGRDWRHAALRQSLSDPRWMRLAAEMNVAGPRRRRALEAAIDDDDPDLAGFAALALHRDWHFSRTEESAQKLLHSWPHRAVVAPHDIAAGGYVHDFLTVDVVEDAPAATAAIQIARLGRTTVEADRLGGLLMVALAHPEQAARSAAQKVFLERLPRQTVFAMVTIDPPAKWPLEERAAFFRSVVDRLRVELEQGDAERAVDVAREATEACHHALVTDASVSASSHMLELGAWLVFHPVHGPRFRSQRLPYAGATAAEECLRSSDPELRRAAWLLLAETWPASPELKLYASDPYLADLLKKNPLAVE